MLPVLLSGVLSTVTSQSVDIQVHIQQRCYQGLESQGPDQDLTVKDKDFTWVLKECLMTRARRTNITDTQRAQHCCSLRYSTAYCTSCLYRRSDIRYRGGDRSKNEKTRAEGAWIEEPRGTIRLQGLGRLKLPSGVWGEAAAANSFCEFLA